MQDLKQVTLGAATSLLVAKFYLSISEALAIFIAILLSLVLCVSLVKSLKQTGPYFDTLRKIPGPKSVHYFGNRWMYYSWFGPFKLNKLHEAYHDLFQMFGKIFREEYLWNFPVINISDRNDLLLVLNASAQSKYPLRPPNEVTSYYRKTRPDRYTNLGLVNEQGHVWHVLRSSLTPELTSGRTMHRFLPELNRVAEDFNSLIRHSMNENHAVLCFDELANRMGLESTCTLILGRRLGFLTEDIHPTTANLADAVRQQFLASRDTFYGLPLWKLFPTPAYRKLMQSEDTIYRIISSYVDEALRDEANTCAVDSDVQTVFMSILNAPDLDIRDKKAAIIDFIAAGIKTFGNTLVFILYLIAKHPECQEKIYEEIFTLSGNSQDFTLRMVHNARYMKACIEECFRLLPTAPLMARISESPMELSGYQIPAGSVLLCHTWQACLDEANFPEANKFLPERWLGGEKEDNKFLVCPFGVGRRMCPGKRFTELELKVCIANILREFKVGFEGTLDLEFEFLLAPRSPTCFIFQPR